MRVGSNQLQCEQRKLVKCLSNDSVRCARIRDKCLEFVIVEFNQIQIDKQKSI